MMCISKTIFSLNFQIDTFIRDRLLKSQYRIRFEFIQFVIEKFIQFVFMTNKLLLTFTYDFKHIYLTILNNLCSILSELEFEDTK